MTVALSASSKVSKALNRLCSNSLRMGESSIGKPITRKSIGVVIAEFCEPNEAYEIEFLDDEGEMLAQLALLPDQLAKFE